MQLEYEHLFILIKILINFYKKYIDIYIHMSNNIIAVSDLEGFNINKYICTGIGSCTGDCTKCTLVNTTLIICGDIMDSTSIDARKEIMENEKIFNLRNIMKIVEDPKIILTLGNRDINKIKCLLLNKLELPMDTHDSNYKLIDSFNKGYLNFEQYNSFVKIYISLKWKEDIINWPIFWQDKEATPYAFPQGEFFLNRFKQIFTESMAAGNMLNSIYLELKNMIELDKSLNISELDKFLNISEDHKAFIVLLIFNRMLQTATVAPAKVAPARDDTKLFHGLLYKLYTRDNTKLCHREEIERTIYLFSHGGLTKQLLNSDRLLNMYGLDKIGNLQERIESINKIYKNKIGSCFDPTDLLLRQNIIFLLALSAPTKTCNEFIEKNLGCGVDFNTELQSPILAGFRNMRQNVYYDKTGKTIYQIFGHQPVGFAATIDLFIEKDAKTYFINLDSTNTFTGTKFNTGDSQSIFKILDGVPSIKSKFNIDITGFQVYIKPSKINTHYISTKIKEDGLGLVEFEKEIREFDDTLERIRKFNNENQFPINFHGINNNIYYFTITNLEIKPPEMFFKSFYILNQTDFDDFLINNNSSQLEPNDQQYIKGNNNGYTKKYLKYKEKYMKLKQELNLI
jgi:hypothetical protein